VQITSEATGNDRKKGETMMLRFLNALLFVLFVTDVAAQSVTPELVREIAPAGKLRAAINFGNPVLAQKDLATGAPRGISVDLSRELARRLGVPVELVLFDAAGKVANAAKSGQWDIAFLAIDPGREGDIAFTAPYVIIEGTYLVPAASPFTTIEQVDREGVRIAVGKGSVYDLYLTRTLKNAEIVRAPSSPLVIEVFRDQKLDVAAGVRQQLVAFASGNPDVRVMPGRFMVIEQAMGTPKGRDDAITYLKRFVEEVKASGFVTESLARSDQRDARVAPEVK
jgi:polar amino acid transport system substrate-binding protein